MTPPLRQGRRARGWGAAGVQEQTSSESWPFGFGASGIGAKRSEIRRNWPLINADTRRCCSRDNVRFVFVSGSILNHEKYENHENGRQKLRLGPIEKVGANGITKACRNRGRMAWFWRGERSVENTLGTPGSPIRAEGRALSNAKRWVQAPHPTPFFVRLLVALGETRRGVVPSWLFAVVVFHEGSVL